MANSAMADNIRLKNLDKFKNSRLYGGDKTKFNEVYETQNKEIGRGGFGIVILGKKKLTNE